MSGISIDSINEDIINKEKFTIINIDNKKNYKCIYCDFYTAHKNSIKRHLEKADKCYNDKKITCEFCKKEFRDIVDKERHMNNKKKCYILGDVIDNEPVKKDSINDLKEDLEKALKEIQYLNKNNKKLEDEYKNIQEFIYNLYSDGLVEKHKRLNNPDEKNTWYKYYVEYSLLYNSLFKFREKINENNYDKIKDKLFLLFDIVNDSKLKEVILEIGKREHTELIPFICEYRDNLIKKRDLGKEKKINGRLINVYIEELNVALNFKLA